MHRTAARYVRDSAAAEDVVQETWLGFLNSLDRFEARCSIKTWLFRILFNKAQSRVAADQRLVPFSTLRGSQASPLVDGIDPSQFHQVGGDGAVGHWVEPPPAWKTSPERMIENGEALAAVRRAIEDLPPAQGTVMSMRDIDGLSSREVCNALDISAANQRVLLHRARTKVRAALAARYGGESAARTQSATRTNTATRAERVRRSGGATRAAPRLLRAVGVAALAIACLQAPATGQEVSGSTSPVAGDASMDLTNRYVFRGHEKDEGGAIFQPGVGVGVELGASSGGFVRGLAAGAFAWSSISAGTRLYPGSVGLYEVDLGLTLSAGLSNGWNAGLVFTSYLAPTGQFDEIQEIGFELGLGTVGRPGAIAFWPRVFVAHEIHDSGGQEDTYLEAGGALELPSTGPVRWAVPIALGMSPDGFYRDEAGDNVWFGFFGAVVEASMDLETLDVEGLPGSLYAGVGATFANRDAEITHDAANDVLWTIRVGLSVGL